MFVDDLFCLARVSLAHLPTPCHPLLRLLPALLPGVPGVPRLSVKRDDLTGAALSGNKVRKLEFLLAEATAQAADTVLTCGGAQSNHCRATALAAARLGLRARVYLRTDDPQRPPRTEGNILLDRLCGAEVVYISRADYARRAEVMAAGAAELTGRGRRPYIIPEGGSNALGCLGYAAAVAELAGQLGRERLTLVHATGSGGTGAGLLLGVALLGLPWRVVGVNVCDDRAYFVRVMGDILQEVAQRWDVPEAGRLSERRDELEVLDGYVGRGYALSTAAELEVLRDVCRSEGLVLDPVYTGKAMGALLQRLAHEPRSLGDTVVFVHTGGIFGLMPRGDELEPLL